jgi:hypothetical protein
MDEKEQAEAIIRVLEKIAEKPSMFISSTEPVWDFFSGFWLGCAMFEFKQPRYDEELWQKALEHRGWEFSARAPTGQMRERGLSHEATIQELVAIEVEVLKRRYSIS